MPRYISKEDVQKGLVDPKKPLQEQPQYKKKIQEENEKKEKKFPEHAKHQEQAKNPEPVKHPKRERADKPQYNWDRKAVTLETPVPEKPKKILVKPDNEKFRQQMDKLKEEKDNLYLQRKKFIDQQKNLMKHSSQNKKTGFVAISKYSGELKEKNNFKNLIDKDIASLQEKKDKVDNQIKNLKDKNTTLRKPQSHEHQSKESLQEKLEKLQNRLSTADIDKKQQARIHNDITNIKRTILKARSDIEIKSDIQKHDHQIDILYGQSKAIKQQIDAKYTELKVIKGQIKQLMELKTQEQGTITQTKSFQQIKAEYDVKIKAVQQKRQGLSKKMDELRAAHNKLYDAYQDQRDLLDYIKHVEDQKNWLIKKKEEQQKRKKEKQQYEKKKLKQFQQRQKRREQRKKQDEERQKRDEERKQKLHKEREAFINRNPNHKDIELCEFLISYCEVLKPDSINNQDKEQKQKQPIEVNLKNKDWEKQMKKGCEVIVGKKNKLDQEAPKKVKKEQKKKESDQDGSINHNIDSLTRFSHLNILPPTNVSQIDQTIKQLQDKIDIYSKPNEEEVAAFKIKAQKQFDRIHGFRESKDGYKQKGDHNDDHDDHDLEHDEQEHQHHKKKTHKHTHVELKSQEFPGLA